MNGVLLQVKVTPKARKNKIVGWENDRLKIQIAAPPVDGKANVALVEFLADHFDLPRSCVRLVSGETSRLKSVRITGMSAQEIAARLPLQQGQLEI